MTIPPSLPLVSVVLGTYNGGVYLSEQLDSLFSQTYPNIEIIAVDDGSSDDTVRILQEYAVRHPAMKVFVNERNLGFIKNFEKGCNLSGGELISLCDQDDWWMPGKVERMVAAIGDHPMIYCDSELCDGSLAYLGRNISDIVHFQSFYDCRQLCVFSRMYGHATLIRRSLFLQASPFREEIPHDGWLAYHATLYGGVKYLPEALVKYRQHEGNVFGVVGGKKTGNGKSGNRNEKGDNGKNGNRIEKREKEAAGEKAQRKKKELDNVRIRMKAYCDACPDPLAEQKKLLLALVRSYRDFSPGNDLRRMLLFFSNWRLLLVVKKYPVWRKWLFCLKMFVKIK
jgi:glycosyltransferase involved in cell wall biosynthesis